MLEKMMHGQARRMFWSRPRPKSMLLAALVIVTAYFVIFSGPRPQLEVVPILHDADPPSQGSSSSLKEQPLTDETKDPTISMDDLNDYNDENEYDDEEFKIPEKTITRKKHEWELTADQLKDWSDPSDNEDPKNVEKGYETDGKFRGPDEISMLQREKDMRKEWRHAYKVTAKLPSSNLIYGNTLSTLEHQEDRSEKHRAYLRDDPDADVNFSVERPVRFNPYPDYNSDMWKAQGNAPYVPCPGATGEIIEDLLVFKGRPHDWPSPRFGSFELLDLDGNLCWERDTRLGIYGLTDQVKKTPGESEAIDWDNVNWGDLQRRCVHKNAKRFDMNRSRHNDYLSIYPETAAAAKAQEKEKAKAAKKGDKSKSKFESSPDATSKEKSSKSKDTESEEDDDESTTSKSKSEKTTDETSASEKTTSEKSTSEKSKAESMDEKSTESAKDGNSDDDKLGSSTKDKRSEGPILESRADEEDKEETVDASTSSLDRTASGYKPENRTAILLRSYTGKKYTENDKQFIRALVSELSLKSGGEYEVYLLVQVKDSKLRIFDDPETYQYVLTENVPAEFQGMTVLWNDEIVWNIYTELKDENERSVHTAQWLSVQKFSHDHPQFDFIWNWEMDFRFTGHYYELLQKLSSFAKKQPRKGLWERNERWYIPEYHGDYDTAFRKDIENRYGNDTVWGPPDLPFISPVGPKPPVDSPALDNYEWGVGEEADVITVGPIFNPKNSNWVIANHIWGYKDATHKSRDLPRRTTIVTQSRISKRLLDMMHVENMRGNHVASEMTPQTVCLLHGFKAVYAPHPIVMDRDWDGKFLNKWFNPGENGECGGRGSPMGWGRERRYQGSSWYYRAEPPNRLFNNWMGWRDTGIGGKKWEQKHGRPCLPQLMLHPVKNSLPIEDDNYETGFELAHG